MPQMWKLQPQQETGSSMQGQGWMNRTQRIELERKRQKETEKQEENNLKR